MNVLSVFDGMSCGRIALERAGIKVTSYVASEIEENAIKISKKNYPDIMHVGDVNQVHVTRLGIEVDKSESHMRVITVKPDILIGGSPCQDVSSLAALHGDLGLAGKKSGLFFQFFRLLKECRDENPNVLFLLENVVMKDVHAAEITKLLGVQPIVINSGIFTAHNRKRMYWTNIPNVNQPRSNEVYLSSILEYGYVDRDKAYCLTATYNNACVQNYFLKSERQHKFLVPFTKEGNKYIIHDPQVGDVTVNLRKGVKAAEQREELSVLNKYTSKLSPVECERLQGVPDNYTEGVAKAWRYHMLGNGWECKTITHLFKHIPH